MTSNHGATSALKGERVGSAGDGAEVLLVPSLVRCVSLESGLESDADCGAQTGAAGPGAAGGVTGGRERSAPAGPAERRVRAFRVVPEGRAPRGAPARSVHGRHSRFFVGRPGTGFLWCQQVTSKNGSGNPFRCSGVEEKETCPPKVAPPCTWQSRQSRRRRHLWLQPGASSRERLASLRWLGKPLSQRPPGRLLGSGRPQGSAEKPEPLSGTAASPVSGLEGASESSGPWTWACRVVCTLGASYIITLPLTLWS